MIRNLKTFDWWVQRVIDPSKFQRIDYGIIVEGHETIGLENFEASQNTNIIGRFSVNQ